MVGKQQSQIDIYNNPDGPYPFNPAYFKTRYGGMQYYNAGCLSMLFITEEDLENNVTFSFPKLRPEGERMAKAFESVIKETEYYKSYRRNDMAVPRSVLEEYGRFINIGLKGFNECKDILKHYLFEDDRAIHLKARSQLLSENAVFLTLIVKTNKVEELSLPACRRLFYDHQLPSGSELIIPEDCITVANKWEIAIGRMYFTSAIEMFWKYMLEQLNDPLTLKEWILEALKVSDFTWDLQQNLSSVIDECVYDYDNRESLIAATARRDTSPYSIENGIKILLSVYNHFRNRKDFGDEKAFFSYGLDSQSISMTEMFELVDTYREKTIHEFIIHILQYWVIEQHYLTALDKMIQGRDGFYYEIIDKRYVKKHEFGMAFQGIRTIQLAQIMRDLDML